MPRPLTKTKQDGTPYQRQPAIENTIRALSKLTPAELIQRARGPSVESPDFVPSECLVYFIREAWRRGDKSAMTDLVGVLFTRCERILKKKIPDRNMPNAEDVREGILSNLGLLLVQDTPNLDYYECRFNRAFKNLYVDLVRKEYGALNQLTTGRIEEDDSATIEEETVDRLSRVLSHIQHPAHELTEPENAVFRSQALRALRTLPDDEQKAFVLVYGLGFEEESDDPTKETAATICGVTGRTIRNRIARAKNKLSRLKEE